MSKIRQSAKGEQCQIRLPNICNFNPETTVLAHWNGGGMGMKQPDWLGSYACSACHAEVDGPNRGEVYTKLSFAEGIFRTQKILHEKGLL